MLLGAALASPLVPATAGLKTGIALPTFTVTVTFGSPVQAAASAGGGGTTTPPASTFSLVDSLALKQVPDRSAGAIAAASAAPPCRFTLTLTQFSDDDLLCSEIRSAIQNGTPVQVEIDFTGLGPAQAYTGNLGGFGGTTSPVVSSLLLSNPISICWNDQPGDDDDFDDIADLGMNKVTITFTTMQPGNGGGPGQKTY